MMLRITTGLLALGMLLTGIAWADEYDNDIIDPTDAPDYEADADYTYVESGEPVPIDSDSLGMYFGTGDEFIGGYSYADSTHYTSRDFAGESFDYHDEQIYYPGSHYGQGYSADNVYGPTWGVPEDVAGMEGYNPEYYMYNPDGEQVWTPYDDGHTHSSGDGEAEPTDSEDGLNITSSESW